MGEQFDASRPIYAQLTMPRFNQPEFEFLSGKTFHAPKPWYYSQVLDGTLK